MDTELEDLEEVYSQHFGSQCSGSQLEFMETQADNYWDNAFDSDVEVEREGSVIEGVIEARARAMSLEPDEGSEDDSDAYDENDEDREKVRRFLSIGCGCAKNCHKNFSFQEIYMHRLHVKEMDTDCRDMYVMGVYFSACHVDAGFANIKRLYRRTDCETLGQLQDIVNKSSMANLAVTYPQWSWRDWKQFPDGVFKPLKCIRKYQYFRFTREEPGIVTVRTGRDAPEQKVNILKEPGFRFMSSARPASMASGGMSEERHRYLFNSVRPYVRQTVQDEFCAPL